MRSSKSEVRCASACVAIIEVRVCVRRTVRFLATQRLVVYERQAKILPFQPNIQRFMASAFNNDDRMRKSPKMQTLYLCQAGVF